ncbi:TPA: hypothetical protein RJ164_002433 [Mannheimia haemolytica]|uniref:hypothetical protein n=2 Tax=Mannheimia haemolytica TaxID=75985 RepID=UPI002854506C|nr:hypothetical protein [Mannheimia haemolytica]HDL5280415.1 hypothetical protein [Mannheimia haemolytica]HDL5354281.1 hypothetical protein [Mannheimia haemolytica]HDL5625870.1 hypothetical protein [Mannheimia haemolytica]HDL5766921.1 hypothetical protein [Mannheimia haemolytica]
MFSLLRDLFAYIVSLSALVFTVKIGSFNENLQHAIVIILPLLFIVIHELIVRKFKKEFDNQAYFSAIVGVALFAALGSFSKSELIELGFKIDDISTFFIFKLYFHTWAIVLLPVALKKFFKKH